MRPASTRCPRPTPERCWRIYWEERGLKPGDLAGVLPKSCVSGDPGPVTAKQSSRPVGKTGLIACVGGLERNRIRRARN